MAASLFGDGIFLVALAWQVYELSNSPAALAVVGVAATVPMVLCLLVGGVVSDRMDRRRGMMSADAGRRGALPGHGGPFPGRAPGALGNRRAAGPVAGGHTPF